ncbi:MAG: ABC transporter permease [Bacteroidia bacterium]|nr:ABC transporter permease [Bacteroidia bacterium]
MLLKLAWRNLWRNKRRTLITMGSVFFAVIFAVNMKAIKEGSYTRIMDNMIGKFVGYVKIQGAGYREEQTLDNSFADGEQLRQSILSDERVAGMVPKIETVSLISSNEFTKVGMVIGTDPELEDEMSGLHGRVREGDYFSNEKAGVLIGIGLAKSLKVGVGDTLVIIGQGFHAVSAAGKYPVDGIIKLGSPDLNKRVVYLPLAECQRLFGMEERLTSYSLRLHQPGAARAVTQSLKEKLPAEVEVMSWNEVMPEIEKMIESDRAEAYVLMTILYMIITFGIFGTVLMMVAERQHEFGVLVAIGMKKRLLATVVSIEVVLIAISGALVGMLGALPTVIYFYLNPIQLGGEMQKMSEDMGFEAVLQYSNDPMIFVNQGLIVAFLACLVAIYPFFKISGMKAIEAMRN